jgi:hypothetical protein
MAEQTKAEEIAVLNSIVDAIVALKEAGYYPVEFCINENRETNLHGKSAYRQVSIKIAKSVGFTEKALEVPGLYEKLATSVPGNA